MSPPRAGAARPAEAGPVLFALGDETRLALVARLSAGGPQSIAGLTTGSEITRQAITKHLDVLARAGVVHDVRRGRERIWELDTDRLNEAGRYLKRMSKRWDAALDRLRKLVE